MTTAPRLVILDTDPGVDDALALLYLRARSQRERPDLRLLAITTVFGNADIETTTRNALWLRQRLGLEAPVHKGAAKPLNRPRGRPPSMSTARTAWATSTSPARSCRRPIPAWPTRGSSTSSAPFPAR